MADPKGEPSEPEKNILDWIGIVLIVIGGVSLVAALAAVATSMWLAVLRG